MMLKKLIVISMILIGCETHSGIIVDCNVTPEKCGCDGHCTRYCTRHPERCTPAQLKELKETGRIKDKK